MPPYVGAEHLRSLLGGVLPHVRPGNDWATTGAGEPDVGRVVTDPFAGAGRQSTVGAKGSRRESSIAAVRWPIPAR